MGLTWLALLVIPLGHQVRNHKVHLKAVRVIWPGRPVSQTEHERKHAARPRGLRNMADISWLIFIGAVVAIALAASR